MPLDLSSLNAQQLAAVKHPAGPALVLAGAGSGKTRVLTTHASWLLQNNLALPENIMLVTFTNKAAQEMRRRIEQLTSHRPPMVGTFHSLCARILRQHAPLLNLDFNFTIYDADDQLQLIKNILKDHPPGVKISPTGVKVMIEKAKNSLLTPTQYQNIAASPFQTAVADIYVRYQKSLLQNSAVDFDDLLLLTLQLLQKNTTIRQRYQNQLTHVLVDEFQDTNAIQYELIKILAAPQNNVFCVGDFAQSIYSWRGADFGNLKKLEQDYDGMVIYRLEQNYRSTQVILDAATQVISRTTAHPVLSLFTVRESSDLITFYLASDDETEANQVAGWLDDEKSNYNLKNMAVLYRTNAQSRVFEEAFINAGLPYTIVGGTKFYERKEIKDLLAYLKLCANPKDSISRKRIDTLGKRKAGEFYDFLTQNHAQLAATKPDLLLDQILKKTDYLVRFDQSLEEDMSRIENIAELKRVAGQFEILSDFLENVALIQDGYLKDLQTGDTPAVKLMSLHSAKGLEFDVVCLVGLEEGLLPHSRSLIDPDQLEEERRLCYVGLTRAKHKLYLSAAARRLGWGSYNSAVVSRFLLDIPENLLTKNSSRIAGRSAPVAPNQRFLTDLEDDQLDQFLHGELTANQIIDSHL